MHGYHPSDPQSYAALLSNQPEIPANIQAIPDIFRLMTADAQLAHAANSQNDIEPHLPISEDEMEIALQPGV
jgi:hypothetical protein